MSRAPRAFAVTLVTLVLAVGAVGSAAQEAPSDSSAALVETALQHLADGQADQAVALLEPMRNTPDVSPRLLALLGTAYLEAGRAGDALAVLSPLADAERADPAVLYNAGRAALASGDVDRAERYLERSVQLQPGTPAARELGLLRGQEGRMREAYRLLRPWVLAQPDDEEARLAVALAAIRLERIADAERFLTGMSMESPRVRLLWAELRLIQNDPQGALAMIGPILSDPPPEMETDLRRTAAEAHLATNQPKQAIQLLEGRVENDPESALKLAQAQEQTGDLGAAIETLKPFAEKLLAIAREPDRQMGNRLLAGNFSREYGRMLALAKRTDEAVPYLDMAVRLTPRRSEAWKLLGDALAATGRTEEAAAARQRFESLTADAGETQDTAAAHDPTGQEVRRAQRLLEQQRGEQALAVIRAEKELAPEDIRVWLMETRILLLEKRPAEALQVAQETVRRFTEYVDAYYQRGAAHLALEHYDQAEEDFRRALDLEPDHVPSMNDLAVLLIIRDRQVEAERLLERILELQPDNKVASQTLERLRAKH